MLSLFSFQVSEHAEDVACNAPEWIYSFAWSASTSHCAAAGPSLLPVTLCQKPHRSRENCGLSGPLAFPIAGAQGFKTWKEALGGAEDQTG